MCRFQSGNVLELPAFSRMFGPQGSNDHTKSSVLSCVWHHEHSHCVTDNASFRGECCAAFDNVSCES